MEYSSTVWDGCTAYEKDSLETVQNEAARIVTGLTLLKICTLKSVGFP